MNLANVLSKDAVLPDLRAESPRGVLCELLEPLLKTHPQLDMSKTLTALCAREDLGSTAMGCVAIPHCVVDELASVALVVGRSARGVEFGLPGQPLCHVFFLILAPKIEPGQHLRLLAQVARRAKMVDFCSDIMLADDRDSLWRCITEP
jgi:PTS system nitrogen regulatory IIA component